MYMYVRNSNSLAGCTVILTKSLLLIKGRDGTGRRATEDKMFGDLRASRNLENVAAVLTNVSRLVFPNL